MGLIYLPATSADQWAQFLADPETQWRKGYSARTLAHAWQAAGGFPPEVLAALSTRFPAVELLLALPEHKVPLPGGSRPSQNDIWALARSAEQLISISVEGKVAEPFGPTVQEWEAPTTPGKQERMDYLRHLLGLRAVPGHIRYQLLHRTASALIEAQRFKASHAVMMVHSFSLQDQWLEDFVEFATLFGPRPGENQLHSLGYLHGISLHIAWVRGDVAFLSR